MKTFTATAIATFSAVATFMVPATSSHAAGPKVAAATYGRCVARSMPADASSRGEQAPGKTGMGPVVVLIDPETGEAMKSAGPDKFSGNRACGPTNG